MANQRQQQTRTAQAGPRQPDPLQQRQNHPPATVDPRRADAAPDLPPSVTRRGIDEPTWRTLCNSVFPGALPESILMAVDYCRARKLDVLKKPCHIVPMRVQQVQRTADGSRDTKWIWRDVILPGIYEYRITARRTNEYVGHSDPEFGEVIDFHGVPVPEFCKMTVYRWSPLLKEKIPYPVTCYFSEVVATKEDGSPNKRWRQAPRQMLTKCTEAAGLREAFPDELGGEPTAEEMEGRVYEHEAQPQRRTKPATQAPRATKGPIRETNGRSGATNGAPAATQAPATEPEQAAETSTGDEPPPADAPADEDGVALATDEQLEHIRQLLDRTGVRENDVCEHFDLGVLEDLPFDQVANVVAWIDQASRG